MLYPESVEFLYKLGNEIRTVKFGLEAIRALLAELGQPQTAFRSVHVAGTNGKGSTSAMIESALRSAGYRTGLYTSPHLVEPTERIRVAGCPVTREQFLSAFLQVHEANERLVQAGVLAHHTTYFETVTAMGFLLFREMDVEIAVVEVGLGGRLDATNVVNPALAVITAIDFDHEAFLGSSLDRIAAEKAGILKPGCPAVFSRQRPEAASVIDARAAELGTRVRRTVEYELESLDMHAYGSAFTASRTGFRARIECPLAGAWQVENALTAVAALNELGISESHIESGIAHVRWPGRLERISEFPEILLDGAHNPAGARALADHIRRFFSGRRVWLIYGAMRDKSVDEITETLFPLASTVVLTAPASPRAVRPEALAQTTDHRDLRIAPTAREALEIARSVPAGDLAIITGSLYLVGEIHALLQ